MNTREEDRHAHTVADLATETIVISLEKDAEPPEGFSVCGGRWVGSRNIGGGSIEIMVRRRLHLKDRSIFFESDVHVTRCKVQLREGCRYGVSFRL